LGRSKKISSRPREFLHAGILGKEGNHTSLKSGKKKCAKKGKVMIMQALSESGLSKSTVSCRRGEREGANLREEGLRGGKTKGGRH